MTSSETKRCHFVPRTYLEKFYQDVDHKRKLVAKSKKDGKFFHPSVTSICVRKFLYTMPGETEEDRQVIEKFYSENIEGDYNTIYDILNRPKIIKISHTQRELIISTVITLLFRNPFILDRFNEFWSRTIDRLYERAENSASRSIMIDKDTINIDKTPKAELQQKSNFENKQIFNISHMQFALRLIELRINDDITVTEVEDHHEYITSDNPVSYTNPQAGITGQFDPSNFLRLPINTKKCIVISPLAIHDNNIQTIYRRKVKANSALLDTIMVNRLQHHFSDKLLIGSFKSLRDLDNQLKYTETELSEIAKKVQNEMLLRFNEEIRKKLKL